MQKYSKEFLGVNQDAYTTLYSPQSMVLIALELESTRNLIYIAEKRRVSNKGVAFDIATVIKEKVSDFPFELFRAHLEEIFVVRDGIVHGHIYNIDMKHEEYELVGYKATLLNDETYMKQGDRKYKTHVDTDNKTRLLKFNVQPFQISYEDVLKGLIMLDLTNGLLKLYTNHNFFFTPYKIEGRSGDIQGSDLSRLLGYYYRELKNDFFIEQIDDVIAYLVTIYGVFIKDQDESVVINNICPKCQTFGFRSLRPPSADYCSKCGVLEEESGI